MTWWVNYLVVTIDRVDLIDAPDCGVAGVMVGPKGGGGDVGNSEVEVATIRARLFRQIPEVDSRLLC